jgi:hypothetical protein
MLQYRVLAGSVADVNGFNCGPGSIVMIGFFEAGQYLASGAIEEYRPGAVSPPDLKHPPMVEGADIPDIPDIQSMNAEDAIAVAEKIGGDNSTEGATILVLLLASEEEGKKRKTVIAAIKEELGVE